MLPKKGSQNILRKNGLVKIKYRLSEEAKANGCKFQTPRWGDSGYDIYASHPVEMFPGDQKLIPTGLFIEIPQGYTGLLQNRAIHALKQLYLFGGVVDPGFRGELKIILRNDTRKNYLIEPGQRIAQMLLLKTEPAAICIEVIEDDFSPSARGTGNFGSTGK